MKFRPSVRAGLWSSSLLWLSCGVLPETGLEEQVPINYCERNSDCSAYACDFKLKQCVAEDTDLDLLLLEVVPRSNDLTFGAYRFLRRLSGIRSGNSLDVTLERPPALQGNLGLFFEEDCIPRPVRLTLTPRERALGLNVQSYTATSALFVDFLANDAYERFQMRIPAGSYDLHWTEDEPFPEDAQWLVPCAQMVPQLARGIDVAPASERSATTINILQEDGMLVRPLEVRIPWDVSPGSQDLGLEGWLVDVIHYVTGERISTRARLSRDDVVVEDDNPTGAAVVNLSLSTAFKAGDTQDYSIPGSELLRLRPPGSDWAGDGVRPCVTYDACPAFYWPLSVAESFMEGVAEADAIAPIATVALQAWVRDKDGEGVSGQVEITSPAFSLTQFRRTISLGEGGSLNTHLPPGDYQVRIYPTVESGLSAIQTELTVWPPPPGTAEDEVQTQAGQVFTVPEGSVLTGRVSAPNRAVLNGAAVHLSPAVRGGLAQPINDSSFSARSVTALVEKGFFRLTGADCRGCNEKLPAAYDLRVLPPPDSSLPWLVHPNFPVSRSTFQIADDELQVSAPFRVQGTLRGVVSPDNIRVFPGPLIRAYALLDDQGILVTDPGMPNCADLQMRDPNERCVLRVVQVAETRAGDQGRFVLLLPENLKALAQ